MIDIVIPCKNSHKTINKLLSSLASQIGIEKCKVTIVNNIHDKNYSEEIERFKNLLDIQELNYSDEVKGVGGARQFGIDNTSNPFIMFIDSDDLLYDNLVIQNLYKPFTENKNLHAVYGKIIEINEKKLTTINSNHFLWMHGVMYKRDFISKNNIRFYSNSAGEDAGFNLQVKMLSDENTVEFLDIPVYFWTDWNKENRINTKEFAFFTSKKGLIDNLIFAINNVMKVSNCLTIKGESVAELCALYFQLQDAMRFNPENGKIFIDWCKLYYNEIYKQFENEITKDEFEYIYFENLKHYFENRSFFSFKISIYEFLELLKEN